MVKLTYKTNGQVQVLMCDWAHVRDGCLVFAHLDSPKVEHHIPVWQMTGPFIIDKAPTREPATRPTSPAPS